ncbi:oligosaccharide flippase family protein [Terribacillus aidingensis]|uniref:oligosaccharide flippase family protein n=1 Tax=Terribacillus aidingensis TaxID=586416 RepID=UPI00344F01BE
MNNLIKKFVGFSIGPLIGAFINLITIPLTTYFINPEEYGKASMFTVFQMMLATFIYLGIDQAYTREYHALSDKKKLFQNAISIPMTLSFLIIIISILLPDLISTMLFGDPAFKIASYLFGMMIFFMVIERFILLDLRMQEKAFEYSVLNILVKAVVLVVTLIFVLFIRRDFLAVVYSITIGQILGDLYLIVRYRKILSITPLNFDKKLLKGLIIFGFPIVIATSISSLLNSLDKILLRSLSDFTQVGIFTATLKVAAVLNIVQSSFTTFWVPNAYRWYEENKDIFYFKIISEIILLVMSVMFFAILFSKDLIVTILSTDYADAKYLVAFLCLQPIIYTISETTCLGIVFSRKSYLSVWVGLIALVPNTLLNLLLIPAYGAVGAAISTAFSYIVFFVVRSIFSYFNGMKISVRLHTYIFIILFATACLNSIDLKYIQLFNLIIFILIISLQSKTIRNVIHIFKHKEIYDFS